MQVRGGHGGRGPVRFPYHTSSRPTTSPPPRWQKVAPTVLLCVNSLLRFLNPIQIFTASAATVVRHVSQTGQIEQCVWIMVASSYHFLLLFCLPVLSWGGTYMLTFPKSQNVKTLSLDLPFPSLLMGQKFRRKKNPPMLLLIRSPPLRDRRLDTDSREVPYL